MFDVRRYMGMDPWLALVTLISDRTYLNLEPNNCELLELESLGGLATRVVIGTNRGNSSAQLLPPLPKQLEYTFDRLNPDSFFRTADEALVVVGLTLPTNTQAILDRLSVQKEVVFDPDDFESVEVTSFGSVTLTSKPQSLRWVGTLTLTLANTLQRPLATALAVKSSPTVFRSLGGVARTLDIVYAAEHDFTMYRHDMAALLDSPNGLGIPRFTRVLKEVTGQDWVCQSTPAQYNLCSKVIDSQPLWEILYSGPPIKRYTTRTDKRNLIVLRLDQTRCTGLTGALLLHFD